MPAQRPVHRDVLVQDPLGFLQQAALDLDHRLPAQSGQRPLHPLDGPEQVDRGRSGGREMLANAGHALGKLVVAARPQRLGA